MLTPSRPSTHAASDLDGDRDCAGVAYTVYAIHGRPDQDPNARPWYHGKAGALPEERVKWHVYCASNPRATVETLTLEGGAQVAPEDLKAEGPEDLKAEGPEDLKAEGTWQYVTTVLAGETRTETFGFDKTNSNGGSWDAGAEISATVGEQVGLSFLAKEGTSITGTARASMKNGWNTAVSPGQKVKRKGTFRKGGALWQWQFHVTKHGHTVTIPANDFALTSSLAEKPKCYPGLSQDGWDYQMCVLGGRLH